ncbi:MAG: phenylalanine 4-monooxygenase [Alphaproteobacteria bacterium]
MRARIPDIGDDFTVPQFWENYDEVQHGVWRSLYRHQVELLKGRACNEFFEGLKGLRLSEDRIPHFERTSDELERRSGWRIVSVPCRVPDHIFFEHLANRRFPAGRFIRPPDELDYINQPDVFHDVFGHSPMLAHPVFSEYMQHYGKAGLRALKEFDGMAHLARLYWYTVEFGLIGTAGGMKIYGSGIVSSNAESIFCLDSPSPDRIAFDLERVMRTEYQRCDFQQLYFVIDSFEQLFRETYRDLGPLYAKMKTGPSYEPGQILSTDRVFTRGTHTYVRGSFVA